MRDQEFIELRNKFLFAVFVALLFTVPLLIFFAKISSNNSNIVKAIKNKKTFIVLITDNNSKNYKKIIKQSNIKYYIINKDKNNDYNKLKTELNIIDKDVETPSVIYVKKGKLISTLPNIQKEKEIKEFLSNYGVIK